MELNNASVDVIRSKFAKVSPHLDEKTRRMWAANEALALGHGGIGAVSEATGIARSTIGRGINGLEGRSEPAEEGRAMAFP